MKLPGADVRYAVHIAVSELGSDDLGNRVIEIVRVVASHSVLLMDGAFGF